MSMTKERRRKVRVRLRAMGLSIRGLARRMNCSTSTLTRWLNGQTAAPSPELMRDLDRALRGAVTRTEARAMTPGPKRGSA